MHYCTEDNGTGRWIVSVAVAAAGMVLFLLLAVTAFREQRLPDLGPLLELDYVTIEEPRKQTVQPPPRVKPREVKKEEVTEPVPQEEPVDAVPQTDIIETAPTVPDAADIPAAPQVQAPPAETDEPHRISSPVELDNVGFEPIFNPKPDYPAAALEARITGHVDVDLVIGGDGKVQSFSIVTVKGHPAFADEVASVLPRWRFPPPRIGGKKTSVKYVYRINFVLN